MSRSGNPVPAGGCPCRRFCNGGMATLKERALAGREIPLLGFLKREGRAGAVEKRDSRHLEHSSAKKKPRRCRELPKFPEPVPDRWVPSWLLFASFAVKACKPQPEPGLPLCKCWLKTSRGSRSPQGNLSSPVWYHNRRNSARDQTRPNRYFQKLRGKSTAANGTCSPGVSGSLRQ